MKRSPVISLLTLEEVYGNIAFYLANRVEIDAFLAAEESEFDSMPQPLQATDPALYDAIDSPSVEQLDTCSNLQSSHFSTKITCN